MSAEVVRRPVDALMQATAVAGIEDLILVAGSLYVVGEVRATARAIGADHLPPGHR